MSKNAFVRLKLAALLVSLSAIYPYLPSQAAAPAAGTCAPAWKSTQAYNGGDRTSYKNHNYLAKWWTQGDDPSKNIANYVWGDQGVCPAPTAVPTAPPKPTVVPTVVPTAPPIPTVVPTVVPTAPPKPTVVPTVVPTAPPIPTVAPTSAPLPSHSKVVSTYKSYDALGRLEKEWDVKGTTSHTYDANGNRKSSTDPLGRVTKYDYDALNRLSQITDPAGKNTLMVYDARDNLVQVTDPEGFKTSYSYNGFNELIQLVSPDAGTTTYTQTTSGQLKTKTDARQKIATYNYDNLGRVLNIAYGDATHTFTYDTAVNGVGKVATITDPSGNTAYQYDAQGYLSQVRSQIGVTARTVGMTWTAAGQAASLTYPSGLAVSYVRDGTGQLAGIQINGQPLLDQIVWSGQIGAQSWRWSNGQVWARVGNEVGQIAGQIQADGVRTYRYDQKGNILQIADLNAPQRSLGFNYDHLDQLALATTNSVNFNYHYDNNGSRIDKVVGSSTTLYSHDATSNRLKSSSGGNLATYTYDAAGNRANDNGWLQTYNNADRLIQSMKGSTTVTYSYNALGQRVKKISPNDTFIFIYDTAGHLLGEYLADGTLVQETVWLDDTPVAVVKPTVDPLKPSISYVWADHLGTPRQITDPVSKQIVWRWDGEPFGADLADENPSGKGQFTYNLRFRGQYFDKETGKHYNYYRDYDPATGRYVQSDPIGLGGGINTYAYVGGNPISYYDPYGLWAWGDSLPQGVVDTAAGFGDGISMGATNWIRNQMGTNGAVNNCSPEYMGGEIAGVLLDTAIGGAAGWEAAGAKGAGKEFSHWIPNRMGGPRSKWNGNFVPTAEHALSDPYRYRFMPRSWKEGNPMPNSVTQQWNRIPKVYKGGAAGAAAGAAGAANSNCGCQ